MPSFVECRGLRGRPRERATFDAIRDELAAVCLDVRDTAFGQEMPVRR